MTKSVQITYEEIVEVQRLFHKYNALLAVLAYMNDNSKNTEILDKKLDEATELYIALENAKQKYGNKYMPEGNWQNYTYDFDNQAIVYED